MKLLLFAILFASGIHAAKVPASQPVAECELSAADGTLHGSGAELKGDMIIGWDDVGTFVSWRVQMSAGEAEVVVLQAAEAVSAGHTYQVEIPGRILPGTVKNTGGWDAVQPVSLGKVKLEKAGEIEVVLRPLKKGTRGVMNLQGILLRGPAAVNAKVCDVKPKSIYPVSRLYPVSREGVSLRGRTDIQLMATYGSCRQTDIRHFALLTVESWDALTWRSAGDFTGFEYEGTGMFPDLKPSGRWPTYRTALEIFVDGKRQEVTTGKISQQLDCRQTTGSSDAVEFQRLDMMLASLQWASAWQCRNRSDKPVMIEYRVVVSDDLNKAKSLADSTTRHVIVQDDYVSHLMCFDRKPEIKVAGTEVAMTWKETVAPGKTSAVSLAFRPSWSEAHENVQPLRDIGQRFTTQQWRPQELLVCQQSEWRAAMALMGLPEAELNWSELAKAAEAKDRLLHENMPRLTGLPATWEGVWDYTYDLLRVGTQPAQGLLTDVWLAASPMFYMWGFYWDTATAAHTYCHYQPDLAARTMRTFLHSSIQDDGSTWLMISPLRAYGHYPQLLNIPMALWDCYQISRDKSLIADVYPLLAKHQDWIDQSFNRVKDGTVADIGFNIDYGSALHRERHVWVDMSMFQVNQYEMLAKMAAFLGKDSATIANWQDKAAKLKAGINAKMWNEQDGAYYALKSRNLEQTKVQCPIELDALTAGVASRDQAKRLVQRFMNPDKYAPGKRGNFFCPSVAFDDPTFQITDAWSGSIWLLEPYYAVRGMAQYGFQSEAAAVASNLYGMVAAEFLRTGSIWEQYRPDNGQCLNPGRRFFTSGITTSILDLFLRGQFGFERTDDPNAFYLTPTPATNAWHGIENLPLSGSVKLAIQLHDQGATTACKVTVTGMNARRATLQVQAVHVEAGTKKLFKQVRLDDHNEAEVVLTKSNGTRYLWKLIQP